MRTNFLLIFFLHTFVFQLVGQNIEPVFKPEIEKIYLQTDRDVYITGEDIWFRADYYMAGNETGNELSRSLYIELITPLGESVARQKYEFVNGLTSGKYPVPEGLLTATYMLRAYTQFQRNYPQEHFTTNLITIINPSVPLVGYKDQLNWKVQIFHEGNGIVNGEISGVAIRIHPKMIKNVKSLKIVDQYENDISEIMLFENGLGYVEFKVIDSLEYSMNAILKNGSSIRQLIPKAKQQLLFEKEIVNSSMNIKLTTSGNSPEVTYSLQIYDGYFREYLEQKIKSNGEWNKIDFPKEPLNSGINYFVLRDSVAKVIRVDALYMQPDAPQEIEVKTSEKKYTARSKVNVTFIPLEDAFESYSVAVVKKGTFEDERVMIPHFIIENPRLLSSYIDHRLINNKDFADQLKAVLLIYESRLESEPSVFKKTSSNESDNYWAPETRGITIRGIVRNLASAKPEPNCDVYIAAIGNEPQLHVYTTNEEGEFIFTLKHLYGIQNLFLCVNSRNESDLEIMVNSDFVNDYDAFYATPTILDTSMRLFIEDLYVNAQLKTYASASDSFPVIEKKYKPIRFPESSTSILLDDYIALPTLREVINEIVPFVKVQKKKDEYSLEVFDPLTNQVFGDPLILIDNLPVFNVNELIEISPELMEKISVINSAYVFGEHLFRGIVFFETNTKNFAGIELPVSSTFLEFQAVEELEQYTHDDHSEQSDRVPDFRNVLYWNPDIKVDTEKEKDKVSFYTSDYEGMYEVIVRGVNRNGEFGLGTTSFTVSEK
jgi:hypothetical protein